MHVARSRSAGHNTAAYVYSWSAAYQRPQSEMESSLCRFISVHKQQIGEIAILGELSLETLHVHILDENMPKMADLILGKLGFYSA